MQSGPPFTCRRKIKINLLENPVAKFLIVIISETSTNLCQILRVVQKLYALPLGKFLLYLLKKKGGDVAVEMADYIGICASSKYKKKQTIFQQGSILYEIILLEAL